MSKFLNHFWGFWSRLFSGLERGAGAFENTCTIAEEHTAGWLEDTRSERAVRAITHAKELKLAQVAK